MAFVRLLLVVMLTLSATISGAVNAGHGAIADHAHAAMGDMAQDGSDCCPDSGEPGPGCHVLPALLPVQALAAYVPAARQDRVTDPGLLPTGIAPSGPLDPPRAV